MKRNVNSAVYTRLNVNRLIPYHDTCILSSPRQAEVFIHEYGGGAGPTGAETSNVKLLKVFRYLRLVKNLSRLSKVCTHKYLGSHLPSATHTMP